MVVWLLAGVVLVVACRPGQPPPEATPLAVGTGGREAQPLASAIRSALGADAGHYAVVVKALDSGLVADVQGERVFYAASLFKLPIMIEAFRQREKGLLAFDDELVVTEADGELDLGTMGALGFRVGQSIAVDRLLEMMITVSDNVSANVLYRRLGGTNVDRGLEELGLKATSVRNPDLPTTAADMATLLQAIATRRAVSPAASDQMAALLRRQALREGIPAGLPPGIEAGNKTGSWSDAAHDVAIVYAPFGTYVLAILSDLPYESPALARLSRQVYECLARPSPNPGRPAAQLAC